MCTWLIQVTTEYKYSPAMVLSYQNGEDPVHAEERLRSPEGIAVDPDKVMYTWLIQLTIVFQHLLPAHLLVMCLFPVKRERYMVMTQGSR